MFLLIQFREETVYDRDYNIDRVDWIFQKDFIDEEVFLNIDTWIDNAVKWDTQELLGSISSYDLPYYLNDVKKIENKFGYYIRLYTVIPLKNDVDDVYEIEQNSDVLSEELNRRYIVEFKGK